VLWPRAKRTRFSNFKKDGLFLETAVRVGFARILNELSREWLELLTKNIHAYFIQYNTILFGFGDAGC
jgi:hypothetical protein